jgi:NADPH:quinone reductase-like Zn-dependent oxidoreductase
MDDVLEDVGKVDLVFDVIGGDIAKRSAGLIRAGGTLVTVTGPTEARPSGGLTIDFVDEHRRVANEKCSFSATSTKRLGADFSGEMDLGPRRFR